MRRKFFGSLLILVAGSIHAGDGVLEINAACRSAGCFPGDDPGAPIQITEPGSYILTSNLSVNVNTTAILIQTDDVTLDLNGFTISGPVSCSGFPATCTRSGIGTGIDGQSQGNITIRNGTVRGMGNRGIILDSGRVVDVIVKENSATGLSLSGSAGQATRVRAVQNGSHGIAIAFGHANASYAIGNQGQGINAGTCSNSKMTQNGTGSFCTAILPNSCDNSTDCD